MVIYLRIQSYFGDSRLWWRHAKPQGSVITPMVTLTARRNMKEQKAQMVREQPGTV